jgi:hypothetical protein
MSFPDTQFTLDEQDGDKILLEYLKNSSNFTFLSPSAIKKISSLDTDLRKERVLELWPLVITDALRTLKLNDLRESPKGFEEKAKTFFDETSLGVIELEKVLTGFSEFEGMMYGASPERYRGHMVHSFRVWIIGHGLLKSRLGGTLKHGAKLEREITQTEWECMWAIVSLCHDIGYPLSQIERVNNRAREALRNQGLMPIGDLRFTFSQQMQPFHDTMIRLMASEPVLLPKTIRLNITKSKSAGGKSNAEKEERKYVTHLQNKYYLKLLKSFDDLEHGVVSSLLMSKALVYFLESDLCHDCWNPLTAKDARQFLIRREILRAIASHTCQDIYHLRFNTLSFLLYMADEIQCWGRPTLVKLQEVPAGIMKGKVSVDKFSDTEIQITITTGDEGWTEKEVRDWVGKLRRMLRLAVGTPELKKSKFRFEVKNEKGDKCYLELKNGQLEGPTYMPSSNGGE